MIVEGSRYVFGALEYNWAKVLIGGKDDEIVILTERSQQKLLLSVQIELWALCLAQCVELSDFVFKCLKSLLNRLTFQWPGDKVGSSVEPGCVVVVVVGTVKEYTF